MASNRSPSPLSSRNCRNSESNSTTRKSFSGNPFPRLTNLTNPKSSNPYTPSNTPTASDLAKRNSIVRKSIGGGSMFQDGKENRKDAFRSPAKVSTKNFMSPTISATSKVTPSPRKKILGEKNEVTRASFEFLGKESDLTSETPNFDQTVKMNEESDVSKIEHIVEQKEVVQNVSVDEVHLGLISDESDLVKIRPFCCSPMTSPVIAANADPQLPPYDPKKNFLSPRPQYLRYKPNPRIEFLLNKEDNDDDCEESDVTRLEDSFDLSDSSSETEEKEPEPEPEQEKEAESGDDSVNSVNGSETDLSDTVLAEKPFDSKAEKVSKPRFFTRSKTVSFVFVLFLVACFSLSFTESPPINLPIYEDVGFSEIYHESLRFAAFAKESFDDLVEKVKHWSMDLVVYLSEQKSLFIKPQKFESLQFFNLTTSPIQEEFVFNRHIGTDYIQEVKEFEEEENEDEVVTEESDVVDEDVTEEIDEQSDVVNEETERIEEPINEQIQSDVNEVEEKSLNLGEVEETKSEVTLEAESERVQKDVEIEPSVVVSNDESEASSLFSTQSIATISVAGVSMVILAVLAVFYMIQKKSSASKSAAVGVNNDDNMPEESGSSESINVQKGNKKKKSNNKRESLASSTSQFSVSDSFGSFTTFERIAIKHKDEVMLTPIRRSSRLLKSQGISS
ncbi:hypothetical protein HanPSC8_Chr16g0720481 [Helianthus annuus]|nr:hypothetical protein HanPSC8_Chr16g0720481 [Helianthus annuus]